MSFSSSSEYVTALHPLAGRNHRAPPQGPSLLRDTNPWGPLAGGLLTPTYVPSSAFLALSTAYSPSNLAGLFHPTATSEIAFQGVSPITSRSDSSPARSLLSFCDSCLRSSCPSRASSCRYACRELIRLPVRYHRQGCYACRRLDPLLSFQPLGCFSEHLGSAFTPPPLMTFPPDSSSDAGSRPSAYRWVLDLLDCLQTISP